MQLAKPSNGLRRLAVAVPSVRKRLLAVPSQTRQLCRAEPEEKAVKSKSEEYAEAMKKLGVDSKTAKDVLSKWKETGIQEDPNALRKMFAKQSLWPIGATLFQILFDGTAAYALHMTAIVLALDQPFWGRDFLALTLDFIATYFAACVFFDVLTLGVVIYNTVKLQTSPQAFYEALKLVAAGDQSGPAALGLVDKAKASLNALKVSSALDSITQLLDKAQGGGTMSSLDTLQNLSAYLTLYRSESQHGFDASSVGMTEADASKIALVFAQVLVASPNKMLGYLGHRQQYDVDDNGRIDLLEFRKLLADLGSDASEEEARAAMEAIDSNKDGNIRFDEFAAWWAKRKGLVKQDAPKAAAGSK